MKRFLANGFWCIVLFLLVWFILPSVAQAQLMNALTRAALQAQNFVLTGSWDFNAGHMKLRRASTAPTGNTIGDFYFNTVSNNWWYTAANGTWTTVAAGNFANPYTPNQAFSGIVDFTGTVNLPRQQTVEVCKAGCGFSTVTAALASITDNSVTKRYQLIIHPGDYDENITAMSYVTVRGLNRNTTRLRGASATTITWAAGITEFGIENITVGGVTALGATTVEGSRVAVRASNVILGIIDGTESASGKTTSCILDSGAKHDIYLTNVECRSRLDGYRVATDAGVFISGGRVDLDDKGTTLTCMRGLSASDTGAQFSATALAISMVKSASACSTSGRSGGAAVEYDIDATTGTRPTLFTLTGGSISGSITGTPSFNNMVCLNLGNGIAAQQANSRVEYLGVDCDLNGGSSTWAMRGIYQLSSDTDWSNVAVRWVGGNIRTLGSGTHTDVNRSSAISGFSVQVMGVGHAGNYGTVGPTMSEMYSTTIPVGQVKTVCKSGCQYTVIADALAAITDAAENKRYTIKIGPGVWDELGLIAKSYVSLFCQDPYSTKLNPGAGGGTIVLPNSLVKDFAVSNCGVSGFAPFNLSDIFGGSAGSNLEVSDCIIGRDVDDAGDHSIDGFTKFDSTAITIVSRHNHFLSEFDFWKIGANATIFDTDSIYEVVGNTGATPIRVVAFSSTPFPGDAAMGAQFVMNNPTIIGNVSGFPAGVFVFHADATGSVESASAAARFVMNNGVIDWWTVGAGTGPIEFAHLGPANANANGVDIQIYNTSMRVRDPGGTRTITGVNVTTDADHANWKFRWQGGAIDLSGGGTIFDIVNSDSNLLFEMSGVRHAGNYSGTAPPTTIDTRMGKFGFSLQGPVIAGAAPTASGFLAYDSTANDLEYGDNGTNRKVANLDEAQTFTNKTLTAPVIATISNTGTLTLPTSTDTLVGKATSDILTNKTLTAPLLTIADLVVGTCTAGQIGIDNGGATKEWCVCGTTNTWGCWKLTDGTFNANGPAD